MRTTHNQAGFSLAELLIAMTVMLLISGAAMTALLKMMSTQATIWNRTQMHSGIRGATEVLQQEVGQAGRITLPGATAVTLANTLASGSTTPQTVNVSSAAGMFVGQKLLIDSACFDTASPCATRQETVELTAVSGNQITAIFANPHNNGAPVKVIGAFSAGIIPPAGSPTNFTNGSTGSVLKLFGDINGDGNMVYVEYTCDTTGGNLYRNQMAWNAGTKPAATASQILLSNIRANPDGSPCFTYQTATVSVQQANGNPPVLTHFVTDVAITLTVQTQLIDPVTKQFQTETKALLNVSPRNVFHAWTMASDDRRTRIQPTPASILALLP
jgi:prepilin-type N-terminal cleavage/methylation domain-containing protein